MEDGYDDGMHMEKLELERNDDPNGMAFFPLDGDAAIDETTQEMVKLPGAMDGGNGSVKGKKVEEDVQSMMGLPFGTTEKPSFFGLPMRIRWELWVQIMAWKRSIPVVGEMYARAEVGRDGHFYELRSEASAEDSMTCKGTEQGYPKTKCFVYHPRTDVVRLEFRTQADNKCIGYSNYSIKDLKAGVPQCGWVSIKDPEKRDEKQMRVRVGKMHVGLMISAPMKAQILFLLDLDVKEILFFQGVETVEDLNPVFTSPSMTPFRWTMDSKRETFAVYHGKIVVAMMELKKYAPKTRTVTVKRDGEGVAGGGFWQCTVHYEEGAKELAVEGSWQGKIANVSNKTATRFNMMNSDGELVAHSEQRNNRDVKLSVDSPLLDPLTPLCLVLVATFAQ